MEILKHSFQNFHKILYRIFIIPTAPIETYSSQKSKCKNKYRAIVLMLSCHVCVLRTRISVSICIHMYPYLSCFVYFLCDECILLYCYLPTRFIGFFSNSSLCNNNPINYGIIVITDYFWSG